MSRAARILAPLVAIAALLAPAPAGAVEAGDVLPFAGAGDHGAAAGDLAAPVVGLAATPAGRGYWQVSADGGVFAHGDAGFAGSLGAVRLNRPVVAIAGHPRSAAGYWLVAADGGVFAFGDARFEGSLGGTRLNAPIVGAAAHPSGAGYWLVAADGGVFAFGDASFAGSLGATRLNAPIVGLAATPTGAGYWLVAADGGVFTFGDARFAGSLGDRALAEPAVGVARHRSGGYWVATADGAIHAFGGAPSGGSAAGRCDRHVTVAVAAGPGDGHWLATAPLPVPSAAGDHPLTVIAEQQTHLERLLRLQQRCQPPAPAPAAGRLARPAGTVTSAYGWRVHPLWRQRAFHAGVDLAGGDGRIRAMGDGVVVAVDDRPGYGRTTVVDHGDGVGSVYAHQSRAHVGVGTRVARGQHIGDVGATGYVTGPHLHVEVRVHGAPTDPQAWW